LQLQAFSLLFLKGVSAFPVISAYDLAGIVITAITDIFAGEFCFFGISTVAGTPYNKVIPAVASIPAVSGVTAAVAVSAFVAVLLFSLFSC
jgi:hypothetical protein